MIAFDKEKFERYTPIERQFGRIGRNRHSFLNRRRAGRKQSISSRHFDDADTTSADWRQALKIAKRRDLLAIRFCGLQDGLTFESADQFAIDPNRYFFPWQGNAPFSSSRLRQSRRSADNGRFRRVSV